MVPKITLFHPVMAVNSLAKGEGVENFSEFKVESLVEIFFLAPSIASYATILTSFLARVRLMTFNHSLRALETSRGTTHWTNKRQLKA